jgi:membrane fusion protein (multidrug efflux system)
MHSIVGVSRHLMLGLAVGSAALVSPYKTATSEPLEFEGRVESLNKAVLSSRLNAVARKVLFMGGEHVEADSVMIELETDEFELAHRAAQAELVAAEAERDYARIEVERSGALDRSGVASLARLQDAERQLAIAEARWQAALVAVERTRLDLDRTSIIAPIDGIISRPDVRVGAYLEAEAGSPLAEIVEIDPILIAYAVPYAVRLDSMERVGARTIAELFTHVTLEIELPGGRLHGHPVEPRFADTVVNEEDQTLTIWAQTDNPDGLLRPGMNVLVRSTVNLDHGSGR